EIVETQDGTYKTTVKVTANDFGAYGKIKAVIDGDSKIESETINVLTDKDNNNIEDAWDMAFGGLNWGKSDDSDPDPVGDTKNGDLLRRYEEYRGFNVMDDKDKTKDKYVTGDPAKKTVFVADLTGKETSDG